MLLNGLLYGWHTRHAANEDNFINLVNRLASVLERLLARVNGTFDEISY